MYVRLLNGILKCGLFLHIRKKIGRKCPHHEARVIHQKISLLSSIVDFLI
jgi:hypothetical protein